MKIVVTAHGCCFLEPLRSARCASHNKLHIRSHKRYYSPLTGEQQKENCAPRAHTAPTARQREEPCTKCAGLASPTNSPFCVVLKHTTRLRIHPCACLKHSNFLNTDRLRKLGLSNSCSHETLLLFGLQQLSQGCVKQLQNSSDRKTGISALNLVEHLCLLGSANSIPIKPGLMSYSRMPSRPYVTRQ